MKLKTDPAINSLTVIYTKGLKLYENQTLSQTSKIFSKLIIKTPEEHC